MAGRGQRWNISLLDFASAAAAHAPTPSAATGTGNGNAAQGVGRESASGSVCRQYAMIREAPQSDDVVMGQAAAASNSAHDGDEMIICGGGSRDRQRTVFLSRTETVRLEVQARPETDVDDQTHMFLLLFVGESERTAVRTEIILFWCKHGRLSFSRLGCGKVRLGRGLGFILTAQTAH